MDQKFKLIDNEVFIVNPTFTPPKKQAWIHQAKPILAVTELFAELAIQVTEKADFVFGDNVDGYYDGSTHTALKSGRYQHQKQHDFIGFQVAINGKIQDKAQTLSADILPYGVIHHYVDSQDSLMLLSGQRAVALSVTSAKAEKLTILPEFNLSQDKVCVSSFEQGLVYQLEGRNSADPQYVAMAVSQACRFSHRSESEQLVVTIETQEQQQTLVVYLTFADTAQGAIDAAKELLTQNGEHQHIQKTYDMLTNSYLWTSDSHYNKALMWSKAAGRCFVSLQYGVGIWAGLPWFQDCWGRDTFIAVSGISMVNGMLAETKSIIENFAAMQLTDTEHVNFGRIPNRVMPGNAMIYNTTDATPWMVREIWQYLSYSGDLEFAKKIYPVVQIYIAGVEKNYLDHHGFMQHRDPDTWMDAKLDGLYAWSPRGDCANDIQALWFTSLLVAKALADINQDDVSSMKYQQMAIKTQQYFNDEFWCDEQNRLADRIDGLQQADFQNRANQLMTLTIPLPALTTRNSKFNGALLPAYKGAEIVKYTVATLVMPWGITSLSQQDEMFHPYHDNRDEYHKDAAYHNGTVWGWNAGFTVTSLLQYGYADFAYQLSQNLSDQILNLGHRGTMSENLDAFPDQQGNITPSGTYAQAWSVSEFCRNGYQDYLGFQPDLLHQRLLLSPCLPSSWQSFSSQLPFGLTSQENSLSVLFTCLEASLQRFVINIKHDADLTLGLYLWADDLTLLQVSVPLTTKPCIVDFDRDQQVCTVNGEITTLTCVQQSHKQQIGELKFAQPNTNKLFTMLQGKDVLAKRVKMTAEQACID